ncbi:MAG: xanthine dehydrogenase family protein subunit M, partial [Acidimicrobiaceae bacterium]|nr:xanthine dehydrogenase family protein subunit M [Acidimicrobiaceae bacterium]
MQHPTTVLEALHMLADDPSLRPVAGGTDLVLELARSGVGGQVDLLDLTHVDGFRVLDLADDTIVIGAGVTHADILAEPLVAERILPLAQACLEIGSPQLRNRATVVGNLVTASPANDTISALI